MNEIILVAALNSGLRGRKGHVTLVSSRNATEDSTSERIAYCTGLVRSAIEGMPLDKDFVVGRDFLIGKDFLGVGVIAKQDTSDRIAPEVFLVWNCRISDLPPQKKERLLEWLRELSGDRGLLVQEASAASTGQTTAYSASLNAWVAAYCQSLPAGDAVIAQVAKQPQSKSQSARTPRAHRLNVFAFGLGLLLMLAIWWSFRFPANTPKHSNNENGSVASQEADTPRSVSIDSDLSSPLRLWQDKVRELIQRAEKSQPADQLVVDLVLLTEEVKRSSFKREEYVDLLGDASNVIEKNLLAEIDRNVANIDLLMKVNAFEELRQFRDNARKWDAMLLNLDSSLRPVLPTDKYPQSDRSEYAEGRFFQAVRKLLVNRCRIFVEPTAITISRDQITWLLDAAKSDLARELEGRQGAENCLKILKSIEEIATPVRIEVNLGSDSGSLGDEIRLSLIDVSDSRKDFTVAIQRSSRSVVDRLDPTDSAKAVIDTLSVRDLLECNNIIIRTKTRSPVEFPFIVNRDSIVTFARQETTVLCNLQRLRLGSLGYIKCEVLAPGGAIGKVLKRIEQSCQE